MGSGFAALARLACACCLLLAALPGGGTAAGLRAVHLDELDLAPMSCGWGSPQRNRSIDGNPLALGGRVFERGVGTHADSTCFIELHGCARRFSAWVGVDGEVASEEASVVFKVVGDGRLLWQSGMLRAGSAAQEVSVGLDGVQLLALVVEDGGDGNEYDHADWAEAVLMMEGEQDPGTLAPPPRWRLSSTGGIEWDAAADRFLPHRDHLEMSGRQAAAVVGYGADAAGRLRLDVTAVWPMLRTLPENTHAFTQLPVRLDAALAIEAEGAACGGERLEHAAFDGVLRLGSSLPCGLTIERAIFPALRLPLVIENCLLTNAADHPLALRLRAAMPAVRTDPAASKYGEYTLEALYQGPDRLTLAPGATARCTLAICGRLSREAPPDFEGQAEQVRRESYVSSLMESLVLETPEPALNKAFAFAKLRAAESVFATRGGLMHSPGGGKYYAAIWANDEAEYACPFFPFLGDADSLAAARNCYGMFARYMNPDYRPIPSSIISEGEGFWNGAGDRGDQAMLAYGAARFALAGGDRAEAERLWPLIEWCLAYLDRKTNAAGVIESDCDELEQRFPAGSANLCTSVLACDALRSAALLGRELGKPGQLLAGYERRAAALQAAIEAYFGATVEGFPTYRYYAGNETLRAWICIPLTAGIEERAEGTVAALFSPRLWTADGLATEAGKQDFWDRSTLYALRGVFCCGATEQGLTHLRAYTLRRLLGEHVPYAVEAFPEGDQRQLSAESALYCRIYTEGLFGIRPTGLRSFTCLPRLPQAWDRMALRRIHACGETFDLEVVRAGGEITLTVRRAGAKEIGITAPEGTPVTIDLAAARMHLGAAG